MRESSEIKDMVKQRRNLKTATASMQVSTRASFISPVASQALTSEYGTIRHVKDAHSINSHSLVKDNSKMNTLSTIVNLCDNEDSNWLKQTEQDRV